MIDFYHQLREKMITTMQTSLKQIRQVLGFGVQEFSELIGLSRQTINNLETQKNKMSSTQYIAICAVIDYYIKDKPELLKVILSILSSNKDDSINDRLENCENKSFLRDWFSSFPDDSKIFNFSLNEISVIDDKYFNEIAENYKIFLDQTILLSENIDYDVIDAVLEAELVDIYDVFLKAHSMVTGHIKEQVELRQAVTRLHNITKNADMGVISEDLFKVSEEQILWEAYNKIVSSVESLFADSRYADSIILLNTLTKPINDYLDNVMVMDKEEAVKQNRLALLLKVLSLFKKWGDFSKLV